MLCGEQTPQWTYEELMMYTEPKYGYHKDSPGFIRLINVLVAMSGEERKVCKSSAFFLDLFFYRDRYVQFANVSEVTLLFVDLTSDAKNFLTFPYEVLTNLKYSTRTNFRREDFKHCVFRSS